MDFKKAKASRTARRNIIGTELKMEGKGEGERSREIQFSVETSPEYNQLMLGKELNRTFSEFTHREKQLVLIRK